MRYETDGRIEKRVEKAETREEARKTIADAGMLLNDGELDQVAGGFCGYTVDSIFDGESDHPCPKGHGSMIYKPGRGWYCPKCEKPS